MKPVVIGTAAAAEIEEAVEYYNAHRPGKGDEFRDEVEADLGVIGRRPKQASPYGPGYRKKVMSGFPHSIFYYEYDDHVWVAAVNHAKREPDAWMDRTPECVRARARNQEAAVSPKEIALDVTQNLPDDATADDILDALDPHSVPEEGIDREFDPDEWEPEYAAEINRRVEDARSGKSVGIPFEDVMRRMREKYG